MATREELINKYCNAAIEIANDDSHGYSNVVGDNLGNNGDYDCGGFVSEVLHKAGLLAPGIWMEPNEPYGEWGYDTILTSIGFERLAFNYYTVQRGDILIKSGQHTEIALGDNRQIGAHWNYDGVRGDYGHNGEICEVALSHYWDYMYRLKGESDPTPITGLPDVPFVARIKISDLNSRRGAGTKYASNGYLKKGVYRIKKKKGEWGKYKSKGWFYCANSDWVAVYALPCHVKVLIDDLNVRIKPSTDYNILQVAPMGKKLTATKVRNDWLYIKELKGWIYASDTAWVSITK